MGKLRMRKVGDCWEADPPNGVHFYRRDFGRGKARALSSQIAAARRKALAAAGSSSSWVSGHMEVTRKGNNFFVFVEAEGGVRAPRNHSDEKVDTDEPTEIMDFRAFGLDENDVREMI